MLFPTERVPYVGLSINLGGWPVDRPAYYNLGSNPAPAIRIASTWRSPAASAPSRAPGERLEWHVDLHVGRCPDLPAEIERLRAWSGAA